MSPTPGEAREGGTLAHAAGRCIALAAAAQAASFAVFLYLTTIRHPFLDMVTWIDDALGRTGGAGLLAYLWKPHNEHHLVLIRLLAMLDLSVFAGSELPFVAASTCALVATAWLVAVTIRADPALPAGLRPLAWLGAMLVLTTAAVVDCGIPINAVNPICLVFVVVAVLLFETESTPQPARMRGRVLALGAAVLASWGNAVGLAAWPVLLWTAWRGGARPRWLVVIAVLATVYGTPLRGRPALDAAARRCRHQRPRARREIDALPAQLPRPSTLPRAKPDGRRGCSARRCWRPACSHSPATRR